MKPRRCQAYFINVSSGRLCWAAACEEHGEAALTNKKPRKELSHSFYSETLRICKTISLICSYLWSDAVFIWIHSNWTPGSIKESMPLFSILSWDRCYPVPKGIIPGLRFRVFRYLNQQQGSHYLLCPLGHYSTANERLITAAHSSVHRHCKMKSIIVNF